MPQYCVNKNAQPNGDHEVHDVSVFRTCLPIPSNRMDLGWHADCAAALRQAKTYYGASVDGCAECAPQCHTR